MNCVLIIAIGISSITRYSLPTIRSYCSKYNLDFKIINKAKYSINTGKYPSVRLEKNQIYDYFDKYDRKLRLDADMLIRKNCPNIFDLVEPGEIGVVSAGNGDMYNLRVRVFNRSCKNYLGELNRSILCYFNSGLILCDKIHKDIFKITEDDIKVLQNDFRLREQDFLNWRVCNSDFNIKDLGYRFNHTIHWDNFENDRYSSYIIHYAGMRNHLVLDKMRIDYPHMGME